MAFVPVSDLEPCKISLAWWPHRVPKAAERLVELAKAQYAGLERSAALR